MSRENVEVVLGGFAAWNAGDMDAVREGYHPDAVMHGPEGWPEPGPFLGREAIMRQFEQLRATFETDQLETLDVKDVADRVIVRWVWHGVGEGPDPNVELTTVYTLRSGLVVFQEYFWDYADALEAVGLRE